MDKSKHDALVSAKEKYKAGTSKSRKYFRDKGYTTVKEKSYFDRNQHERKNIRDNMKEGSNMHKYLHSKKIDIDSFRKRNNPFPQSK